MIKLAVSGCQGRMGQKITGLALADKDFEIYALLESPDRPDLQKHVNGRPVSTDPQALKGADVVIEFTTPEATLERVRICAEFGVGIVIGTTGCGEDVVAAIREASTKIPIVYSSNMSVGVNLVFGMIRKAAQVTGQKYEIRLSETHHIHKKDAPSGTAKTMAEIAEAASGVKVKDIESIREGEVIGDHTITFESDVDLISLHHHAKTRDIFAQGALVAAKFLAGRKNGLYTMQEVLGL